MENSIMFTMNAVAGCTSFASTQDTVGKDFGSNRRVRCKDGTVFKLNGLVSNETACALHGGVADVEEDLPL